MKILQSDLQVVELKCARKRQLTNGAIMQPRYRKRPALRQPPSRTDKTLCWRTRVVRVPNYSYSVPLSPCVTLTETLPFVIAGTKQSHGEKQPCIVRDCFVQQ